MEVHSGLLGVPHTYKLWKVIGMRDKTLVDLYNEFELSSDIVNELVTNILTIDELIFLDTISPGVIGSDLVRTITKGEASDIGKLYELKVELEDGLRSIMEGMIAEYMYDNDIALDFNGLN